MGKTSLLRRMEVLTDAIPLYLNLQGTYGDPLRMGEDLANQMRLRARHDFRLGGLAASDGPLLAVIKLLVQEVARRGQRILLLVDEAEVLLALPQEELAVLRDTLHVAPNLRTIMTATRRLLALGHTTNGASQSFAQGCIIHYLPPLEEDATRALICQTQNPDGAVVVDAILQDEIIRLTDHHPYLIQYLCSRLWQRDGSLRAVTDYDAVVLPSLDSLFRIDFNVFSVEQQHLLGVFAAREPLSDLQIREIMQVPSQVQSEAVSELVRLGCVVSDGATYSIGSEFLRSWLRMQSTAGGDTVPYE